MTIPLVGESNGRPSTSSRARAGGDGVAVRGPCDICGRLTMGIARSGSESNGESTVVTCGANGRPPDPGCSCDTRYPLTGGDGRPEHAKVG